MRAPGLYEATIDEFDACENGCDEDFSPNSLSRSDEISVIM
eukprot:CAMPEP_0184687954 /NCGR_PEP_ID=MMETSP0312-20130426/28100_1 /TAXON_ID=31354 /ORGANISM="Compsopogon coeruleus, Strain SAG 36.94" /LENGTH=40 /DNA_ID= /DNA_START= /DNA_END= /DNA_ORIENTATION=